MARSSNKRTKPDEFEAFERLTKKLLSVPKKDIEQAENGRKKRQTGKKKSS